MSTLNNSTGPRTPEGKAISSLNALKHGYSSKNIIIMPGQEDDFQQLQASLLAEVRPEGVLETTLFQQLLRHAWTIHRVEIRQVGMAASGTDPLFDSNCEKDFDRLERYHARCQSGFHRSLRELRSLQTNRVVKDMLPEPLGQGALPALVKATEIIAVAKRTHKQFHSMALNNLIAVTHRSRQQSEPRNPLSPAAPLNEKEVA